ncbi:MAG: MFS transporter [Pseudomonadota bacterium]
MLAQLTKRPSAARNIALFLLFKFVQSLVFWQSVWFLYFQDLLSGAQAILLYAIYDLATTVLEVPSGFLSDRIGRRVTMVLSASAALLGALLLVGGSAFWVFATAQICLGAGAAFASGTDSSLLYESLTAEQREDEVERQELLAWRAGFAGFALSAVTGGFLAQIDLSLPFMVTVGTAGLALICAFAFCQIASSTPLATVSFAQQRSSLTEALRAPVLVWLFALTVVMYGFSHLPFVFGQPFILEALDRMGLASSAPAISGTVTALMMGLSLAASAAAPSLRSKIGLAPMLCLAVGMQIALVLCLALSNSGIVIALLVFRMVPDALSRPFVIARIQPELQDASRATYLSLQSLIGRLLFAASLWLAASGTSDTTLMSYPEIQQILWGYTAIGVAALVGLILWARGLPLEGKTPRA